MLFKKRLLLIKYSGQYLFLHSNKLTISGDEKLNHQPAKPASVLPKIIYCEGKF